MVTFKSAYKKFHSQKLTEARVNLLEKGIYPFNVFLKEHTETIKAAEKIEKLEEVATLYKDHVPTFYMFVQQNSAILLEGKNNTDAVQASMVNFAFICEALSKSVNQAVKILATKHNNQDSLYELYKADAVQLLEFCVKKSQAYKLVKGNADVVINNLAKELSQLSISQLANLCESTPLMRLYVSKETHTALAKATLND